MEEITADIRSRLAHLPGSIGIGQPISHRIDHMLSGVRSQIAIKVFGEDLDVLRGQADLLRAKLAGIPGLADLEIEKQVLAPQIKIRVDYAAAGRYGVATANSVHAAKPGRRRKDHRGHRGQPPLRAGGSPARAGAVD
jgi:HME family heavy-metal exporter